jgi:hypothetical protein
MLPPSIPPQFLKTLAQRISLLLTRLIIRGKSHYHADAPDRLLRTRRNRPRRHTA